MRIGFLIQRRSYYRLLGPIIERALAREWTVECWHDWSQPRRGTKATEFPETMPSFQNGIPAMIVYHGTPDLGSRLAASPPDAFVALHRPPGLPRNPRTPWFGLQYTLDVAQIITPSGHTDFDAIGIHSQYWWERVAASLRIIAYNRSRQTGEAPDHVDEAAVNRTLEDKASLVSVPELDQLHWIDRAAVRAGFDLAPDRPVVLYIPFPFNSNPKTFWLDHVYGRSNPLYRRLAVIAARRWDYWSHIARRWNDRAVVEAVRAFCDANDAALVVKARAKDPVPRYLRRAADRVLDDRDSYYPAKILELLSISSLCLHFFSTVSYEAAYAGVPSICVAPAGEDIGFSVMWQEWFLNLERGGSFNFPGVVYPARLDDVLTRLPSQKLGDYPLDATARAQYVEKFVGFDDGKSSDRVLDAVQSLVERGARA